MTKVYLLPNNAGFVVDTVDENTDGSQYTISGNKITVTDTSVAGLEPGFVDDGALIGAIQNAISEAKSTPREASVSEMNLLLGHLLSLA